MLLAFLLLTVALQQLGSPLFELVDRDHPARGIVRLLTFGEIASQPCPYSLEGLEVTRVRLMSTAILYSLPSFTRIHTSARFACWTQDSGMAEPSAVSTVDGGP